MIERILFLEALYRANPSAALRRQAREWFEKYYMCSHYVPDEHIEREELERIASL